MEKLLKGGEQSSKQSDAINFRRLMKDGHKVSYVSNARVTEEDQHDWMALPLVGEDETEATCPRNHFLLLHVPSVREFLHKFDALPRPSDAEGESSIKLEDPDIDTNSVVDASVITTVSSAFTTDYDDVIDEDENLKTGRLTSPMKSLSPSASPFPAGDSSYFEPDTNGPSEKELVPSSQKDLTDLAEYFVSNFGDTQSAGAPETTQTPYFSTPPFCTFKIDPAPAVDCSTVGTSSLEDPPVSMTALTALMTAAAAATPTVPSEVSHGDSVGNLSPSRKVVAVAVKKQLNVQSPCPLCYVMVERLDDARAHIEDGTCMQIGANACDVCGKRLSSKWTLKKHVERHSEKPRCVFCSNRFDSASELRDHNLLSGHMFRPEEASAGSVELSLMRKQRRLEQKGAVRERESADNLASMAVAMGAAAAREKQPAAKKRKTTCPEDEAARAVAFLMAEEKAEDCDE